MSERYWSVEEANRELEGLREPLERIRDARRVLLRTARRIRQRSAVNGGGAEGTEQWEATRTLRRELEAISARGIVLRDAESGLVDFPSRREGRAVYLCWRLGEDRVGHWHEVDAGFSGRKPL